MEEQIEKTNVETTKDNILIKDSEKLFKFGFQDGYERAIKILQHNPENIDKLEVVNLPIYRQAYLAGIEVAKQEMLDKQKTAANGEKIVITDTDKLLKIGFQDGYERAKKMLQNNPENIEVLNPTSLPVYHEAYLAGVEYAKQENEIVKHDAPPQR